MYFPDSLGTLPSEIFFSIACCLPTHDLAQLSYTCKSLSRLVEPLIWTDIELHEAGYHESRRELDSPAPFRSPGDRAYHTKQCSSYHGLDADRKAGNFFTMLQLLHKNDIGRLKAVAGRVKHLCTVMKPFLKPYDRGTRQVILPDAISVWNLLPFFSNLETLELHGFSFDGQEHDELSTAPPLEYLRFAKLWAFIPRTVAAWVLRAGLTLERLEIGMLDRPIGDHGPYSRPLPEENLADGDDESDYGSLGEESVIPRPLGGFLPSSGNHREDQLLLPKLKHMHLCQPAQSSSDTLEYSWSSRAEAACFADWKKLLVASSKTLETLVLDQRPGAGYIEADGLSETEFMLEHRGDHRSLIKMVEKTMLESQAFDHLKKVYLYGLDVGVNERGAFSHETPSSKFMQSLKSSGIHSEARLGTWCFYEEFEGSVHWANWNADDDSDDEEEDEDDEDGQGPRIKWDTMLAKYDASQQTS
ncbi:hypothetical protein HJFPF1_02491 [Paramyrothecium foliicola]|nr:hypothetical protein HJFPF1_02491 [Paramyrothecium foliicola]